MPEKKERWGAFIKPVQVKEDKWGAIGKYTVSIGRYDRNLLKRGGNVYFKPCNQQKNCEDK